MSKKISFRNAGGFISDVAVIVGTTVGVGLITGKETQIFVATPLNAAIFAVVFSVILLVIREFCRVRQVTTLSSLAKACFPKRGGIFSFVLSLCSFVCVATTLAGVQQCLNDVLPIYNLPVYAILVAAVSAVVLLKGMSALKICNVLTVLMSAVLFAVLYAQGSGGKPLSTQPQPYMPVAYALFNLTMSLAVVCKLGGSSAKTQNVTVSVVSAVILAVLLIVTACLSDFSRPLPTLSGINAPALKVYAVVTVTVASVGGVVSCASAVVEQVDAVISDKTTSAICVFALACAFAMFGFDFVVRYGYIFVALVGAVLVSAILFAQATSNSLKCNCTKSLPLN